MDVDVGSLRHPAKHLSAFASDLAASSIVFLVASDEQAVSDVSCLTSTRGNAGMKEPRKISFYNLADIF